MADTSGRYSRRPGFAVAMAALSLLAGGCATVYEVDVDALSNPNAAALGYSYEIVPLNPSISPNNQYFQQARRLVSKALTTVGMYEVADGAPAEITIGVDFGVGMRQSSTFASTNPMTQSGIGPVTTVPGSPAPITTTNRSGYTSYSFRKYLSIVASVGGPGGGSAVGPRTELWRVDVSLVDRGDNMEYYLPILAGVASEYVNTDTGEKTTRRVSSNDEVVTWIKQGP